MNNYYEQLQSASIDGDVETIANLLSIHPIDAKYALILAAENRRLELVRQLLTRRYIDMASAKMAMSRAEDDEIVGLLYHYIQDQYKRYL